MANSVIDLHGQYKNDCLRIIQQKLTSLKMQLSSKRVTPNTDSSVHILKIICGAGKHSSGGAVLKGSVKEYLNKNVGVFYDFYGDIDNGVFYVRYMVK